MKDVAHPATGFRQSPAAHGLLLGLFALFTALLLALAHEATRGAIADRKTEDLYASIERVLPANLHDNDPASELVLLKDEAEGDVTVHIASRGQDVTAVAFELTGYGYSGAIRVLMGVGADGALLGVRVLQHSETPGLGDKIEAEKSDWIDRFAGRSIGDPAPEGWKLRRDGGEFDQFSGASITPRAVVGTVYRGLGLFGRHRDALLSPRTVREKG